VRKNPQPHSYSSSRRKKKVKHATKHWVCEKVKDFLITDATNICLRKIGLPWRQKKTLLPQTIYKEVPHKTMDKKPNLHYLQGGLHDQQPCRMLEQLDQAS